MNKDNELKWACRDILDTTDKVKRYSKRVALRDWLRDKTTEITMQMVDELDYEEIGIFMVSGAGGDFYNYARRKREDMKGDHPTTAEGEITDIIEASRIAPCYDPEQGVDQFLQDVMQKMIQNTDDDTLQIFHEMIYTEIVRRHPPQDTTAYNNKIGVTEMKKYIKEK